MFASQRFIGKNPILTNMPTVAMAKPISNKNGEGISPACESSRSKRMASSPNIGLAEAYISMMPKSTSEIAMAPTII